MAATLLTVTVSPRSTSIKVGGTVQFSAIGFYSDGTTKDLTSTSTWASTVPGVATIDPATGIATTVAVGTSTVTATSGGLSGSVTMTVVFAQHNHVTPPIIMNTPLGHLKFRQSFVYDTPQVAGAPDPHRGHINYVNGATVILPPKPQDALQPNLEIRADIPAPRFQGGQEGLLVKDPAYSIKPIVESPTSSDSTAGIWRHGKTFAGKIKF
jgi:hypothetical protein